MEKLSNAFSVLELDAEDDKLASSAASRLQNSTTNTATPVKSEKKVTAQKKSEKKVNSLNDKLLVKNDKQSEETLVMPSVELKLPLVWIDLEMTGLNVEIDRILEIACIITDGNLTKTLEGPDLVIHQNKECLDKMGEWCQSHHKESGLTKKVLQSTISEKEAEKQVMEFVKGIVGRHTPLLAGNSIYVDLLFLKKYMPDLAALFSHVLVDVSSLKALCIRWYPRDNKKAPSKKNKHRAMDDIRESIMELKYYRDNIFKASKSRK
ncbi:oligoribonuclease isoform X1 [Fagus crenata]